MCIRDRTGVVQRYIGKNVSINLGKADALLTESEQIKGEVFKPTAVSYTHLDVYKRQVLYSSSCMKTQ